MSELEVYKKIAEILIRDFQCVCLWQDLGNECIQDGKKFSDKKCRKHCLEIYREMAREEIKEQ